MKCGFCGLDFSLEDAEVACQSCPINTGCHLVRCPNCGYEMPPESKLVTALRGLRRKTAVVTEELPIHQETRLSEIGPGLQAVVSQISTTDSVALQKLIAMNVLPGSDICLICKNPCVVFQTGCSQFAIDEELANLIGVRLTNSN